MVANDPADRAYLTERAADAYTLLFERDDAFLGRNRPRAARLAEMLAPLSSEAAVKAIVAKYAPRCEALPEESRAHCRGHFAALRGGE
jgi:hypothetical protein